MIDPITEQLLIEEKIANQVLLEIEKLSPGLIKDVLKKIPRAVKTKKFGDLSAALEPIPDISMDKVKMTANRKIKGFTQQYNIAKSKLRSTKGEGTREALSVGLALASVSRRQEVDDIISQVGEKRFHPRNTITLIFSLLFLMKIAGAVGAFGVGVLSGFTIQLFTVAAFLLLINSVINVIKKRESNWLVALI